MIVVSLVYHAVRTIASSIAWAAFFIAIELAQPDDWFTKTAFALGGLVSALTVYQSLRALRRLARAQLSTPPTKGSTS